MGLGLIGWALYKAKKRDYPKGADFSWKDLGKKFLAAFWGLLTPVVILGGIFSGIFTPSEAAAVAVVYSVCVAFVVYRGLNFKKFYHIVIGSGITSALIMFIIATAKIFGWGLAFYQIPQSIASFLLEITGNIPVLVYLMVGLMILIAGMFMETASALIILCFLSLSWERDNLLQDPSRGDFPYRDEPLFFHADVCSNAREYRQGSGSVVGS